MEKYARLFDAEIRKAGARTVLFATWARRDQPGTQARIDAAYDELGSALGAIVARVGAEWASRPGDALHAADGNHAAPAGMEVSAAVIARALSGPSLPRAATRGDWRE